MKEQKRTGALYIFNSAQQEVLDVWGRTVKIAGPHTFEKVKDTIMDKLHGHSWYIMDGWLLVDVGRRSYVETRCLQKTEEVTL